MSQAVGAPVAAPTTTTTRRRRRAVGPGLTTLALLGLFGLLLLLPSVVSVQPYRVDLDALLRPPSPAHPLGTDETGRDALARLIAGARMTLGIGFGGAALALAVGAVLGAWAGYGGGAIDAVLMRLVDFALAFPTLFLILIFASVFSAGPIELVVLIGLTGWMSVARLIRGSVRELLLTQYVEAAQALGAGDVRIVGRHLLPNTTGILFVAAVAQTSRAILTEATISFLGLGIQPPEPTWGNMLIGAQHYLYTAPWLAFAPGLAITMTMLALYALGMDRALGPRATATNLT